MSWQLASFAVLGAVLVGGFAWYERTRPPAQVVALVAALAALGVAGRIALAPIPNVVATTDVAIFAGYALGPAPGFAVGALAGVVSNFWLGQGPWTPWQMAAWGLCGVFGALLAVLARRRGRELGRIPLAAACGGAGVLYGAILNFSLMAGYGGEFTLERFLALESRAVPFDAAHAIGNITLALVAGPAMVRMLVRFRERFEWKMAPAQPTNQPNQSRTGLAGAGATLLCAALLTLCLLPASATAGTRDALRWLVSAQNRDGGYGASVAEDSNTAMTGWAMLGLEAAGRNPLDVGRGGRNPVAYLRANAEAITDNGDLARTILALAGAGLDPRSFAERNLVRELRGRSRRDGSWEGQVNITAFAILALRGAGSNGGLGRSLRWLLEAQNGDGGWGFIPGQDSDADSTGAALQAVSGATPRRRAVAYLSRIQRPSGGWALAGGGAVNAQSTSWALQGLIAAGVDPGSVRSGEGSSGLDYLAARQAGDGHFRYSSDIDQTPIWVTAQAVMPVAGEALPLPAVARLPAPEPPNTGGATVPPGYVPPAPAPVYTEPPPVSSGAPAAGGGVTPARRGNRRPGARGGGVANSERLRRARLVPGGAGAVAGAEASSARAANAAAGPAKPSARAAGGDDSESSPLLALAIGVGFALLVFVAAWFNNDRLPRSLQIRRRLAS